MRAASHLAHKQSFSKSAAGVIMEPLLPVVDLLSAFVIVAFGQRGSGDFEKARSRSHKETLDLL